MTLYPHKSDLVLFKEGQKLFPQVNVQRRLFIGLYPAFFLPAVDPAFVHRVDKILAVGIPALRIYLSAFCIMNINILVSSYFQSVGKEKVSIYISIIRGFLLNIVLAFVLPSVLPATILWAVVPLSELITLIFIIRYIHKEIISLLIKLLIVMISPIILFHLKLLGVKVRFMVKMLILGLILQWLTF